MAKVFEEAQRAVARKALETKARVEDRDNGLEALRLRAREVLEEACETPGNLAKVIEEARRGAAKEDRGSGLEALRVRAREALEGACEGGHGLLAKVLAEARREEAREA